MTRKPRPLAVVFLVLGILALAAFFNSLRVHGWMPIVETPRAKTQLPP